MWNWIKNVFGLGEPAEDSVRSDKALDELREGDETLPEPVHTEMDWREAPSGLPRPRDTVKPDVPPVPGDLP
jgi:hypothetical protein